MTDRIRVFMEYTIIAYLFVVASLCVLGMLTAVVQFFEWVVGGPLNG